MVLLVQILDNNFLLCYNAIMIAEVIVDIVSSEVDRVFDYKVPEFFDVKEGDWVQVPFGNKYIDGFIIRLKENSDYDPSKLKNIASIKQSSIISVELIELMHYMVDKFCLRKIDILRLFLPSDLRNGKVRPKFKKFATLNENIDINAYRLLLRKNASMQHALLNHIEDVKVDEVTFLNTNFTSGAVNKFIEDNILIISEHRSYRKPTSDDKKDKQITLNNYQAMSVEQIEAAKGETVVLFGVTGSGKTEVYMHVIERVIKQGKTAIMLVPEISLTPQVMGNFKARFGDEVAVLHSGLSSGERYDEWERLLGGECKIAIGARSAIFAPLKNLGVIVIDEEHDSSYTSDSNPRYNTIDVARFRSRFNNCPVVLGSATPSIETFYKAKQGEYKLVELPHRVNNRAMPTIEVVDMYHEIVSGQYGIFSNTMISRLSDCVRDGKQAMVFLNRRGYVSYKRCLDCGYIPKCQDCDVSLVYHREDNLLKCHLCDKRYKALNVCPECGSRNFREGATGTQKVVDELQRLFPNTKIFRMDNDNTRTKDAHHTILKEFSSTSPSILVGTQMIAKGHDFPLVTMVGIVDADVSLNQVDYRASERCFQLITQVAGRAGRSEYTGGVVLQTYFPRHYVYRFACNYDYTGFYDREIGCRLTTNFPPYVSIVRVLFSGDDVDEIMAEMKYAYEQVLQVRDKHLEDFIYCKAVACPVKRVKTKFRYQILMRIKNTHLEEIVKQVYNICGKVNSKKVNVFVEINPQSLS